jgi:hypothetical protein
MAFTSHIDSAIDVCFENILREGTYSIILLSFAKLIAELAPGAYRTVELDVDIGSSAFDYAALQKSEVPFSLPNR